MKTVIMILIALSLTGCGYFDRVIATTTGIAHTCIDGVEYLQFTSGASVAYTHKMVK